ncbi:arginine/serine-rich coiled-coil protein 2-like isoform X4 [Hetaerina americana]|uniref:arginine/serine-rich coiled-coil protein 2-like isoform X4 n=1 Tax=Hetaerina americana TaxID=62018 RepID=UPI003A7F11AE
MDALVNYGSDDEGSDRYMENKGRAIDDSKTVVKSQGDSADDVNYDNVQMDMSEESDAGQRQKGGDARRNSSTSSSPNSSSEEDDEPPRVKHRNSVSSSRHSKKSKENSDKDGGSYNTDKHRKREDSRRSPGQKESSKHRRKERSNRRSRTRSRERGGKLRESKERDREKRRRGTSREKGGSHDGERENSRRKSGRESSGKRSRSRERARDRHHSDRRRSRSRSPHHHRHHHGHHDDDRRSKRSRGRSPSKTQSALSEGLGLQVEGNLTKTAVTNVPTSLITPQILVQRSLEVQASQVHNTTGIQFPSYYNPAAMNPMKYAEQMQKRKKLWGGNKDTAKESSTSGSAGGSTNNWESTTFAQDQDGKLSAKFKRLMGIKTPGTTNTAPAQPEGTTSTSEDVIKKQEELFSTMERQYEAARLATHTLRGVGLGFGSSSAYQYPR